MESPSSPRSVAESHESFSKEPFLDLDNEENDCKTKESREDDKSSSGTLSLSDEDDEVLNKAKGSYFHVPYGFQSIGSYKHASKNCEIGGVSYNYRFRQFVILDSRGITSWSHESVYSTVTRHLNYPAYQFNVLRMIIFSRKFNVYFALSKDYALKVFNLNFHEVISVSAEMHSVLCMVFNPGRNELITGGTGGMKFWRFGELIKDKRKSWHSDTTPMANYGLVLRASYPKMGGSWVKHVEIDVAMQRLYCLSERNVVAYDMMGNELFQITSAHRGPVTGCVFSISCNLLVTAGNDNEVNVWSRSGGLVHTFSCHTKVITKIMIHPESSGVVITASLDGMVKVFSLDIMEEIYSLPVFPEGINWMECVSPKIMYCSSNRQIEVFALNHVVEFWALSRCCVQSFSIVTSPLKSSRVMAVGSDSSVRLMSRDGRSLSTVLPPPSISPLTQVISVTYSREFNIMYLLVDSQQIWIYYTRTNPATRLDAWQIDHVEDIHTLHSTDHSPKSRASTAVQDGPRSLSPRTAPAVPPSPRATTPRDGGSLLFPDSSTPQYDHVSITCLGLLCSPVIMESMEGSACPDATHFLLAGTEDGRVLFLHMFCKGMKYSQLKVHKGLVLEVKHDEDSNTLVTLCRSLNGIDAQFWSLPDLTLVKQITCQSDVTCHVQMDDLFLCGHKNGSLVLHRLAANTEEVMDENEDNTSGGKRPTLDHQGPINSVGANSLLGIFCSSSTDGFLRLWDKSKILLREILLDSSVTAACFLNTRGDVIIGFSQHIFIISHTKVFPNKATQLESGDELANDDESFETESDIYEDPSVRYEGKKILQPDPTNMENYLVPFPNLRLKTSFFMEDKPPPDLQQQNQQDELETLSSMTDSLSLAPTEIYFSPSSTPRSMSLCSGPALERRESQTDDVQLPKRDIWQLPDFGDSPVSSPPRTPPPEPTPPPTPPPEEVSDDEEVAEVEEKTNEQEPPCENCQASTKVKTKKGVNFPSFKKEGGRLTNVRIDSKSLRSSYGGPSYAAPVQRQTYQPTEPKLHKARRPPKYIAKKTKKQKDKPDETTAEQNKDALDPNNANNTNNQTTSLNTDPGTSTSAAGPTQGGKGTDGTVMSPDGSKQEGVKDNEGGISRYQNNWSQGQKGGADLKDLKGKEVETTKSGTQETQDREKQTSKDEALEPAGQIDGPSAQSNNVDGADTSMKADDQDNGNQDELEKTSKENNTTYYDGGKENPEGWTQLNFELPGDIDPGSIRVVYIDPDTGDPVEGTLDEMPEGAKILEIDDEDSIYDNGSIANTSGRGSARASKKQKSVTFKVQRDGNKIQGTRARGPNFQGDRSQRARSANNRLYVVPSEDPYLQGNLIIRGQQKDHNVSPLTIFALARNRKENAAKQARRDKQSRREPGYSVYTFDQNQNSEQNEGLDFDPSNLSVRISSDEDFARPYSRSSTSASERPGSSKKPENNVMKWCINALKKSHQQLIFPVKPSRPGSSQSTTRAVVDRQAAVKQDSNNTDEGKTLFINLPENQRPKSSESIHTVESREEFEMYPYQKRTKAAIKRREVKQPTASATATAVRAKTAPAHRRISKTVERDDDNCEMCDDLDLIKMEDDEDDDRGDPQIRCQSVGGRPYSSLDFPSLDVDDYAGDWQEIVLTRARLLKQQRTERQKSAKERRENQQNLQKEKWKKGNHSDCTPADTKKPEREIEFISPSDSPTPPRPTTPFEDSTKLLKEQELTSERPYRLRIHPHHGGGNMTSAARSLLNLRSNQHSVADIAKVLPKANTSASIPSKCRRFVLVTEKPGPKQSKPTTLEQTLLMTRFPKDRSIQKHHIKTRPRSSVH